MSISHLEAPSEGNPHQIQQIPKLNVGPSIWD